MWQDVPDLSWTFPVLDPGSTISQEGLVSFSEKWHFKTKRLSTNDAYCLGLSLFLDLFSRQIHTHSIYVCIHMHIHKHLIFKYNSSHEFILIFPIQKHLVLHGFAELFYITFISFLHWESWVPWAHHMTELENPIISHLFYPMLYTIMYTMYTQQSQNNSTHVTKFFSILRMLSKTQE